MTLNVDNFDAEAKSETENFSLSVNLILRLAQSQYEIERKKINAMFALLVKRVDCQKEHRRARRVIDHCEVLYHFGKWLYLFYISLHIIDMRFDFIAKKGKKIFNCMIKICFLFYLVRFLWYNVFNYSYSRLPVRGGVINAKRL